MAGHRSLVNQLLKPSNFNILYGWEINNLSCRYKNFTPATTWLVVYKRSKHSPPHCSAIRRQRYLKYLSMWAYCIIIRTSCPFSNSISIARAVLVDVPVSKFNCYNACYNIWRLIFVLERSSFRLRKRIEVCTTSDTELLLDSFVI